MTTQSLIRPLSEGQARQLTDNIGTAAESLWALLLEAQEREAWRVLGYESWTAYVDEEFDFGRSQAYRLIDQGKVIRALRDASQVSPKGDGREEIHMDERTARVVVRHIEEVADEVREAVAGGAAPQEAVDAAVARVRPPPAADKPRLYRCPQCEYEDVSTAFKK